MAKSVGQDVQVLNVSFLANVMDGKGWKSMDLAFLLADARSVCCVVSSLQHWK